ncbi:MAG: TrmH family RNA methyltransferase [Bacteroidetes bacterium]|nr:TrmH family RNA methyltransferase [Bacteroidota bacterium]
MRKVSNPELQRISVEDYKSAKKTPIVLVLDNVRSLNNIGSAFRTADAFLIEAVYLCGITACPPNAEINKTALGAQNSVSWKYFASSLDALNSLKQNNFSVYAIEQAEPRVYLQHFIPSKDKKYAFIFGNEVKGVDAALMNIVDGCIEIPQYGTKHSLNISVSIGVVLWDVCTKLRG